MIKFFFLLIFIPCIVLANKTPALPNSVFINQLKAFKETPSRENFNLLLSNAKNPHWQQLAQYAFANSIKTKNKKEACQIYSLLSVDKNFYFNKLAQLRASEYCSDQKISPPSEIPFWLNKEARSINLKTCKDLVSTHCIEVFLKKSKEYLPYFEKVQWTQKALEKAKKTRQKKWILQSQQRLVKIAPRFLKMKKKSDYLKVANDYRKNRDFPSAKKYYDKIINGHFSSTVKFKAYKGLSKSYKLQRMYPQYVKELERLYKLILKVRRLNKKSVSLKLIHDSSLDFARASWTYTSRTVAEKTLKKAIQLLNKKYTLAEVYWVLARIAEEKLHYKSSIWWLQKAQKERAKNSDLKDKISWHLAWNEKKLKRYSEALTSLKKLTLSTENVFSKAKYIFWQAKINYDLNKKKKARPLFLKLIKEHPMSIYSLLAHHFLNKKISYHKSTQQTYQTHQALKEKLQLDTVDWLLLLDELGAAKELLKNRVKKIRSSLKENDFSTIFHYYAKTELYLEFFYLVSIQSPERQISLLSKRPEFLFPQPFKDKVYANAKEFSFDPNIIYSIMRQESAFNPKARSFADAFGLLQLIPKVAKTAQKEIIVNYNSVDDLFLPEVNIRLGSFYLKSLWKKYNQSFILATASYNANEKAIRSWLKTRYKNDTLSFIEDIPYEETRNYIKLVMRNYVFYQLINSQGSIYFPKECLEIGSKNL